MFTLLTTWMSLFVKYKWNKKLELTEESVSRVMHIVYKLIILSLVYVVGTEYKLEYCYVIFNRSGLCQMVVGVYSWKALITSYVFKY